jgi:hypothetical protein
VVSLDPWIAPDWRFELAPSRIEKLLLGRRLPRRLLTWSDQGEGEAFAAAAFELFLQRFAFGFRAFAPPGAYDARCPRLQYIWRKLLGTGIGYDIENIRIGHRIKRSDGY